MHAEAPFADSVRALIARVGGPSDRVRIQSVAPDSLGPQDAAAGEAEVDGGVLTLRATDAVAASAALARYLGRHVGRRLTWEAPTLEPPLETWPDAPRERRATPFGIRYHLNVVTHGYSTPYWDWPRWERELDWMAMHGVTHPLVLTGYEVVLAETFRRSGADRAAVATWIGSAAHLPWLAMGGMHSFGGPLPSSWETRRIALARRILDRARELGMVPVLPMTGGHVPPALAGAGAGTIEWQGWRTPVLAPESEGFQRLASTFLHVQEELLGDLGPAPVIAVDPYIESLPPSGEVSALAAAGAGIHRAIAAAHPGATWLLQGWPFHYHRDFWTPRRVDAFLSRVPQQSLLLIDLWGEHAPMWRGGMHDRRWLWTAVHNFGGRFALFGDLEGVARDLGELAETAPARLEGVGLAPEAIENNSVFYERATDAFWRPTETPKAWLSAFAAQRYGATAPAAEIAREAWSMLADTLYAAGRTRSTPSPVIARPWSTSAPFAAQRLAGEALSTDVERQSANTDAENDPSVLGDLPRIARAARLLISIATDVPVRAPLERDVVELTGHVLAQGTRVHIRGILNAVRDRDGEAVRRCSSRMRADLLALDALASTRAESRLATWVDAARAWGRTSAEADVMERDARSLVSVWGHQSSGLHDYSGRHWSGLVGGLYLPRWQAWAEWLADATERAVEPDVGVLRNRITAIEEVWRDAREPDRSVAGDPVHIASSILDDRGY